MPKRGKERRSGAGVNRKVNKIGTHFSNARLRVALIVAGLSALALPAIAAAQQTSPTDAQYADSLDFIAQGGRQRPERNRRGGSATSDPGGLPFTGLDVGLLAAVAAGLLIAGLLRPAPYEAELGLPRTRSHDLRRAQFRVRRAR